MIRKQSCSSTWTADMRDVFKRLGTLCALATKTQPRPWPKKA